MTLKRSLQRRSCARRDCPRTMRPDSLRFFCSQECNDLNAPAWASTLRPDPLPQTCQWCDKVFTPEWRRGKPQKYHDTVCRRLASEDLRRARRSLTVPHPLQGG